MSVRSSIKLCGAAINHSWDTHQLSEVTSKITDGDHLTPKRMRNGHFLLSARNILDGAISVVDVDYVGDEEFMRMRNRCNPESGDILISCSGTIGRVAVVPPGFKCVLVRSAALAKLDHSKVDSYFLQYYLQSREAQKQILASVNQGAQPNLFINHIERILCPLPPIEEQRSIGQALRDVDTFAFAMRRLIGKKRDLKQAAMQQLLNGQTRLPGFTGDWGEKSIAQIALRIIDYRGRTPRKLGMEWGGGDIPALSAGNVKMGYIDFGVESYFASNVLYERWMLNGDTKRGDLLLTTEAPLGNVALVPDDRKYILSQRTILISPDPKIAVNEFMLHQMMASPFQRLLADNASGSTASGIQRKKLETLCLALPPLDEQSAIAKSLRAMDLELSNLEKRQEKLLAIKQGMMQQLLTGRTRLV